MRPFKQVKRTVVYLLVRVAVWLFNVVPRRTAVFVGGSLGLGYWLVSLRDRYKAVRHLTLAFGDGYSHRERLRIGRGFFINSGKNIADVLRFRRHYQSEILPLIECEGLEYFQEAYDRGKGMFGVTGHIGNFELLAAFIQSSGFEVAVIGRELYDKRLDEILIVNRAAVGLTNIATTDSPKRIVRWLRDGKVIGVLIDTDSHRVRGEFVPAFGRWSYTPVGQTLLGLKTGAAFVPAACVRTGSDGYKVIIRPAIEYTPTGATDRDVFEITSRCTAALEQIVRQYPDQWPWQHNRWRTRRNPVDET